MEHYKTQKLIARYKKLVKILSRLIRMKFINKNFSAIKSNFLRDVKTDNILIPTVISFGKRNCKYVIGYMDNDYKTKPLNILLPKTSTYVKSMMVKLNGCFILLKRTNY